MPEHPGATKLKNEETQKTKEKEEDAFEVEIVRKALSSLPIHIHDSLLFAFVVQII